MQHSPQYCTSYIGLAVRRCQPILPVAGAATSQESGHATHVADLCGVPAGCDEHLPCRHASPATYRPGIRAGADTGFPWAATDDPGRAGEMEIHLRSVPLRRRILDPVMVHCRSALLAVALAGATTALAAAPAEAPFLAENTAAMTRMMAAMQITPSGDVDRDFVAMMNPHHQGAIDMAVIELRYGKNEQLRRIAQEIIVDQMQEIAAMNLAIGKPVTDSAPAPTQQQLASTPVEHHHSGMHMDMSSGMKN